jgi:hypothetical protein
MGKESKKNFFSLNDQYPIKMIFMTINGETARLNKDRFGNSFGGRYGAIKETKRNKAAIIFIQYITLFNSPNFFIINHFFLP